MTKKLSPEKQAEMQANILKITEKAYTQGYTHALKAMQKHLQANLVGINRLNQQLLTSILEYEPDYKPLTDDELVDQLLKGENSASSN